MSCINSLSDKHYKKGLGKTTPRNWTTIPADLYLNLWDQGPFHEAIANDGRSYTKELFERANQITCKSNLKSTDQLDKLSKLVKKVEELRQSEANEELELSEIPEEFLDLLMCTLMKEPVILPTSKTTVNLSTIKQHFLSDATDPFN
ncbi:hypothetical protein PSTT_00678 [Puccinia striiformis]|uniref:U-box domain-containing protein n=1 Tax=Puccinia striiformis TaxID=27350 RepID=A0A2S4W693_9BASI|nr:hypothetical protein PSTT_00678 [Puccinia striiformis]